MKKLILIISMMVVLTNCTRLEFDSFDPTTSMFKWIITNDKN